MEKNSKIYVAGHTGLVGSALMRYFKANGYTNIITRSRFSLDLTRQVEVERFFKDNKPEYVILAAAYVGGVWANMTYGGKFAYENLMIQCNVIHNAYLSGVKKLLQLGSSCIYPRNAPQPIREEHLLSSPMELTNISYAVAKIAGIKMCEGYNHQYGTNFISIMPTNLYGINDNYNLDTSHLFPAFLRKIHLAKCLHEGDYNAIKKDFSSRLLNNDAKMSSDFIDFMDSTNSFIDAELGRMGITRDSITFWGSGTPKREFLSSEDMAEASVFAMNNIDFKDIGHHLNIGTGTDITLIDLAQLMSGIIGFKGEILWDNDHPDGTPAKRLDVSKMTSFGWKYKTSIEEGIKKTYKTYLK